MLEKKVSMIPLKDIEIKDSFWSEYMEKIRINMIPYQWKALNDELEDTEPSYCIRNFRRAAGLEEGGFGGMVFQDSDVYKWLEAVAYSLQWHPDTDLEKLADDTIALIHSAQQSDGYLDTYYILNGLEKRFTNLMDHHELYCLGHLIEAAVAYYHATGKRRLLDTAIAYVNCVNDHIGLGEGKIPGYPGHEIAEMALIRLYEITKDIKHLNLAKYFIDQRGQNPLYFAEEREKNQNPLYWDDSFFQYQYYQAGKPVREQDHAEGHAVRAVYLYSGMTDVASATEDKELFEACQKLWNNIVCKQMYITGAIGSSSYGEAFTFDYDLPNDTVYAETCASIGLIFFARRMFEITKDAKYADVMERCLYNSVISGMSLDGKKFFYVNPLEVLPEASEKDYYKKHVKVERQKWFACACCPPNVARLLTSLGGYAYESNDEEIFVNLYIGGNINVRMKEETQTLHVESYYPWEGKVTVSIENENDRLYDIMLRIPGWCNKFEVFVNDEKIDNSCEKGYLRVSRTWKNGDKVSILMDMPVVMIEANPQVREDIGKVALMRGPIVYCIEEIDNGAMLPGIYLNENIKIDVKYEKELLDGVVSLEMAGYRIDEKSWDEQTLYRTYGGKKFKEQKVKFIPYYAWANRGIGEMLVWTKI